jgi:hypothetical protein
MDLLDKMAAAVTSGKSLKAKNMAWLVGTGVVDVIVLLVVAFHKPIADFSPTAMTALRASLGVLLLIPILILSSLLSNDQKARLVFWRWTNPLPGSRAFTKYGPADHRIDLEALRRNIGQFPEDEREQNRVWYRLYKEVHSDITVEDSHQKYLLFRDIAAMSALLVPIVPAALFFFHCALSSIVASGVVFLLQYIATAVAGKNNGIRFVQNVLAIHATRKVGARAKSTTAKPAGAEKSKQREARKKPDADN